MFNFLFYFLHCPLSGPVLTYISLLIIPCMIVYVTNNKEPWTLEPLNLVSIIIRIQQAHNMIDMQTLHCKLIIKIYIYVFLIVSVMFI